MNEYTKLKYKGGIVGYRAETSSGVYDVEAHILEALGVTQSLFPKTLTMRDFGGVLLTLTEHQSGRYAKDITHNQSKIREVFGELINRDPNSRNVPKPQIKIKTHQELQYTKGISVIMTGRLAEHGEYQTMHSEVELYLIFKTKSALIKATSILGYQLEKNRTLEAFNRGNKAFKVLIDNYASYKLHSEFGYPTGVLEEGFTFIDVNHYSKTRIETQMKPPHFRIEDYYRDERIGTTADGEAFTEYVKYLKESFARGSNVYYPNISLRDIQRM